MAEVTINNGSGLGNALSDLLTCPDIQPGDAPSYATCKALYEFHVLGAKLAEAPIAMAQSQAREIVVAAGPDQAKRAFEDEWRRIGADKHIFNVMRLSRIYGVASVALLTDGEEPTQPVDYEKLWNAEIGFNILDPLNTAGSLVGNLDPNSIGFLKTGDIAVAGQRYHRSRTVVKLNEEPIYLGWTSSAFGYVGRSVYQRTLYPLRSFIQTMVADDLVALKCGVLVAKLKQPGSIIDNMMQSMFGQKRNIVKDAQTGNVISVGAEDSIETLNMRNVNDAMDASRKHILENIASGADMPAQLLNAETFAEGFGEGTEDAKAVARYIDRIREDMRPVYDFFDRIVQYRAWNEEFYKTVQAEFPDYQDVPYKRAFYDWRNSFTAEWPSLLTEPDSEKVKVDDTKLKAAIAMLEVLMPTLDPENKAAAIAWACDCFNGLKMLFPAPLVLDFDALREYVPPEPMKEPAEPRPFSAQDAAPPRLHAAA